MIEKYYKCDLCKASCAPETLDAFLIGIYWIDYPTHGWTERPAREVEHHICTTCLKSLQVLGRKPAKETEQ